MLRSTVYPGVTKLVYDRVQSKGAKVQVAFCPERIAEGKAMEEIRALPQIISAFEPEALRRARDLFHIINDDLIELTPLEAELGQAVHQQLALSELRDFQPVLSSCRELRPRFLPHPRRRHPPLSRA